MAWPSVTYIFVPHLDGGDWISQTVAATWSAGAVIDFTAITGTGTTFELVGAGVFTNRTTVVDPSDYRYERTGEASKVNTPGGNPVNTVLTMAAAGSGVVVVKQANPAHANDGNPPLPTLALDTYSTGFTYGAIVTAAEADAVADGNLENAAFNATGADNQADTTDITDPTVQPPLVPYQSAPQDTDKGISG